MATKNPRLAITVPAPRLKLLKRLARLQGCSPGKLINDMLQEFYPVLERVTVALEMAEKAQATTKEGIREAADKAIEHLEPMLSESMVQFDLFMKRIETASGGPSPIPTGVSAYADPSTGKILNSYPSQAPEKRKANPRVVTRGSGSKCHPAVKTSKALPNKAPSGLTSLGSKK